MGTAADMEEADLVVALRAGEEAAFERMVRAHGGRLLAVARRYLGDGEDARDVLQETFISAFRSIGSFDGRSQLSTWLHRIVINASLMRIRARRRRSEEPIDDLLPKFQEEGHHVVPPSDWSESCEKRFEREEVRLVVRECIESLPEGYRTVLLLRDIEEVDTKETARLLGLTEGGAKVRLHRARQALRSLIEERLGRVIP